MVETISLILKKKGHDVWSLPPEASVYEAIAMMADKGVGALLVVSEDKLVGIISERDYARKVILKGKASKETPIYETMTREVVTVSPEMTVEDCMKVMTHNRVRHLPVMEGDKVVGVISIGDLVNSIISSQAETIEQLTGYITDGR